MTRRACALEEALDEVELASIRKALRMGQADRFSDDLGSVVRAPVQLAAVEQVPPGEHTPDTVAP